MEIFCFYKYGIIPEERFNNTTNPRVYINRFRELEKNHFILVMKDFILLKKVKPIDYLMVILKI